MAKKKNFVTMDGNTAAAHASYAFTEVAGIYPITPSSGMADSVDQWAQQGRKNIFGQPVHVVEMQSEGGAAGVVHGSLATGALTTTYTASQGLLLMIPNMYKMAGELLPAVFHVTARAVAGHALSIFGDHSDVMAARQTGFAILASNGVQSAMDLGTVAHLSAIKGRVPFLHFFDGFRTSHEIQKIEVLDYDDLKDLVDMEAVQAFRERGLTPNKPTLRGTAQNPDIFFQEKEAANPYYNALPDIVEYYMDEITKLTGRPYKPFVYHGDPGAKELIICMGSVYDTVCETSDYLNANGRKTGAIHVHLYRPFSVKRLLAAIPDTVEKIAVLDRTKEPGAYGDPLFLDVAAAIAEAGRDITVVGGRYGLGSKDTKPAHIAAVYDLLSDDNPQPRFTIGIRDDVTNLSLPVGDDIQVSPPGTVAARFWGLGSDGTVGANKNSIKIIGDHTPMYAQAYFSYDSKKSGGVTISDLRFGHSPIRAPYLVGSADFVACHNQAYVHLYDMLKALKKGGSFLLNTTRSAEELGEFLPGQVKRYIAENDINLYIIDAVRLAQEIGLRNRINTICQAAFFKITEVIPVDEAVKHMKAAIVRSYGDKGDEIVNMNYRAVDAGIAEVQKVEVPVEWRNAEEDYVKFREAPEFVLNIADVMNRQEGDSLPVSVFTDYADGTFPMGTSQFEKRGIAVNIPKWIPENCIQCNQCAYVCPHAAIRPFLLDEEEKANKPESFETLKGMRPYDAYDFRMQVSALDCTGCGSCAQTCPAKEKALVMRPLEDQLAETKNWEFAETLSAKENPMNKTSVKGSQFERPLLEFSGACAGCGETPYVRLATQLFGDRMMIANATGCSSIWGGSAPSMPYCVNEKGFGPSWGNSLFEDNAEYGLGMHLGVKQLRNRVTEFVSQLNEKEIPEGLEDAIGVWFERKDEKEPAREVADAFLNALNEAKLVGEAANLREKILELQDYLMLRSTWIVGGDGWAYDIGYGGLDHVLASGEDVNVLVLDTEVYSNTGGQASKATQLGAVAQFAAGGKRLKKKDLGMMAMSYGYVYVAQIAMGANQAQTLRALREAEAWNGPSLVIAYAPCINHGIRGGMSETQRREKDAVETGYWHLWRYNPQVMAEDDTKNPFTLDSKPPTRDYTEFLKEEVRYTSLYKKYTAEEVDEIFALARKAAEERYHSYLRLAEQD
ncbi:MAG: pyruvate:ferredoxin (flavodoxin) oxidoreductase [Clostridiaceae bacterium]|jgi:pyruvate-ferredoxin/flavodoxin oxidoreductase|nr:pyruvate:ferredoxin (flavodoxin) oxidoreductase [Clostridia bacterium]MBP6161578.1 pyruvate:ferredoxin (flavodoxin) oxidoreductase [Clostridia bacterium]MBP6949459.1 pyruvate:ferredoxin (flavodoxin) oxidoreductase [Clostridia bacterium]NMA35343.1 pyruvate:ferredoxin (flavodoxin) oxidoreductase [Clostridiaceae bacterium]